MPNWSSSNICSARHWDKKRPLTSPSLSANRSRGWSPQLSSRLGTVGWATCSRRVRPRLKTSRHSTVWENTNCCGEKHVTGGELTGSGQLMGTLDYMASEQGSHSHRVDIRADIYSLGATLYKLLCGQSPFGGAQYDTPVRN